MDLDLGPREEPEEDYCGWTLRDRLELLAFGPARGGTADAAGGTLGGERRPG
jgi:hypothetical protein